MLVFKNLFKNNQSNLSIEQFLQIPLNYIENLVNQLDLLCCTCEFPTDANYLLHVLKELRQCSLHISSIESSTSQNHCTTTMSLGLSSLMNNTEDHEIIELQNRLQFTKDIQVGFSNTSIFLFFVFFLAGCVDGKKSTCDFFGGTFITK